jgi:hypothetical protein
MDREPDAEATPHGDGEHALEMVVSDIAAPRRATAISAPQAPAARPHWIAPLTRRVRRQAVIAGALLAALLVISFGFYGSQIHALLFPPPPPPLQLHPDRAGMQCLQDAAWSPDSTAIALLGQQYDGNCADDSLNRRAGLVTIFDANDGTRRVTIHPDDLIIPTVAAVMQVQADNFAISVALLYEHVLWSPDGKHLAVTFWADTGLIGIPRTLPDGEPAILDGVLVMNADGTAPQVLTAFASAYGPTEAVWDLAAGSLIATPQSGYGPNGFGMLTPALAYRWQADGTLAPVGAPLDTITAPPAPPLGPVGVPDGASSFTAWQPGVVIAAVQTSPVAATHLPGVYVWQGAPLAAWSSDGRYLLDGSAPAGLLVPPGSAPPTQDTLNTFGLTGYWRLPLRDAGLAAILRAVDLNDQQGIAVAWRPDGRAVAAYTHRLPGGAIDRTLPVTVYDCATGHVLATLRPSPMAYSTLTGQAGLLRWSPDGAHLLLFDDLVGVPLVWGPRQLA